MSHKVSFILLVAAFWDVIGSYSTCNTLEQNNKSIIAGLMLLLKRMRMWYILVIHSDANTSCTKIRPVPYDRFGDSGKSVFWEQIEPSRCRS